MLFRSVVGRCRPFTTNVSSLSPGIDETTHRSASIDSTRTVQDLDHVPASILPRRSDIACVRLTSNLTTTAWQKSKTGPICNLQNIIRTSRSPRLPIFHILRDIVQNTKTMHGHMSSILTFRPGKAAPSHGIYWTWTSLWPV